MRKEQKIFLGDIVPLCVSCQ